MEKYISWFAKNMQFSNMAPVSMWAHQSTPNTSEFAWLGVASAAAVKDGMKTTTKIEVALRNNKLPWHRPVPAWAPHVHRKRLFLDDPVINSMCFI